MNRFQLFLAALVLFGASDAVSQATATSKAKFKKVTIVDGDTVITESDVNPDDPEFKWVEGMDADSDVTELVVCTEECCKGKACYMGGAGMAGGKSGTKKMVFKDEDGTVREVYIRQEVDDDGEMEEDGEDEGEDDEEDEDEEKDEDDEKKDDDKPDTKPDAGL